MPYDKDYYEGGEYSSYAKMEDETKHWYSEVLSLAGIESGQGKALDVGCAYGYSLGVLSNFGFEPFGMDLSEYAVEKARKRTDARVSVGDVQEFIPFNGKFDLITCLDTLEHLERPERAIANIYEKIKDGGLFVASTPNKDWWRRKAGLHDERETHTNVRTADEWEKVLETLGWSELEVRPLQTIPVIWRVFDCPTKFRFPWGEIVHIKAVK